MKRALTLIITLTLLFALAQTAFAGTNYSSNYFGDIDLDATALTSEALRPHTAALLLLDYIVSTQDADLLYELDMTGSCYIAAYRYCVDVYYPRTDGNYLNLFLSPNLKQVTDFGVGAYDGSAEQTYYTVDMFDVILAISEMVSDGE